MSKKIIKSIAEFTLIVGIAAAAYFLLFTYVLGTGVVTGISMEPTLSHGDLVLINKLAYKAGNPKMGDIVAFPYPPNPEKGLIKRVIGVGGDVVDYIDFDIYINGEPLPEEYMMDSGGGYSVRFPITVPEGAVFVLGDNRWASEDSRYTEVGCIMVSDLLGKVPLRLTPINKLGFLH